MGMSIDEAIYCMKSYLPSDDYTHCTECKYYGCNTNGTCKSNEAHQKAISIMRKYQKIEQIVKTWDDDENAMILADEIRGVLDNGNDD